MVRHTPISRPNARGFSLIELLITLAVVASLAAVMFPAFGKVHEMARRLMCQNNMRNLYMALEAFEQNSGNRPESLHVSTPTITRPNRPLELVSLTAQVDSSGGASGTKFAWDGLGKLWRDRFISDASTFYCPAHRSFHTLKNHENAFADASDARPGKRSFSAATSKVYGNYHYWDAWNRAAAARQKSSSKSTLNPFRNVLLSDGLRTQTDLNHGYRTMSGCNLLKTDGAIDWIGGNPYDQAVMKLPANDQDQRTPEKQEELFNQLVAQFDGAAR